MDKNLYELIKNAEGEERVSLLEAADIRTLVKLSKPHGAQPDTVNIAAQAELQARMHLQSMNNLKVSRVAIVIAALSIAIIGWCYLPGKIFHYQNNYVCTFREGRNPLTNVVLIEEGIFSKSCKIEGRKKPVTLDTDCSDKLNEFFRKGFICKRTGLDLD